MAKRLPTISLPEKTPLTTFNPINKAIIMIKIDRYFSDRRVAGDKVLGIDIGPDSARSIFGECGGRKVIKVNSHKSITGRWGQYVITNPAYWLICDDRTLLCLTYDKWHAKEAKSHAKAFLDYGNIPYDLR